MSTQLNEATAAIDQLEAELVRDLESHARVIERASEGVLRWLIAIQGGVAIAIGTWLEQYFSAGGLGRNLALLPYLGCGLAFALAGLVTASLTPVLDVLTGCLGMWSTDLFRARLVPLRKVAAERKPRDKESDNAAKAKINRIERATSALNWTTVAMGVLSWLFLVLCCATIALGVLRTVRSVTG